MFVFFLGWNPSGSPLTPLIGPKTWIWVCPPFSWQKTKNHRGFTKNFFPGAPQKNDLFRGTDPWSHFGRFLVDFGLSFGTPLAPFGSIWRPFGSILGPFGSISDPFCSILDPAGPSCTLWAEFQTVLATFSSKLGSFGPFSVFWRLNLQKHLEIYPEHPNFLQFVAGKLSSPGPRAELLPQATEIASRASQGRLLGRSGSFLGDSKKR